MDLDDLDLVPGEIFEPVPRAEVVTDPAALLDRLAVSPGSKTILFVSEGLVVDREISDLEWVAEHAAKALERSGPLARATLRLRFTYFVAALLE